MPRDLIVEPDVPAQTRAYLRTLYSARFGQRLQRAVQRGRTLPAELGFARSLDFAQLANEQQARIRNLSHSLRRACQFLAQVTSQEQFRLLVAAYAEHALFWRAAGRSLGENFCLFAYQALNATGASWQAEIARLDGVSFGVAAARDDRTPWRSQLGLPHQLERSSGIIVESYRARECLLDAEGQLAASAPSTPETNTTRADYWVRIRSNGEHLQTEVVPC
jgi:hypothetical protein